MRLREGFSILLLTAMAAACSGTGPGATQSGNGGGNGNGGNGSTSPPQATEAPQPTADGGNGGNGGVDFSHGKATFTVSGPIQTSDVYAFIPQASLFGGPAGTSLSFSDNVGENASLLSILISQDGSVLVSWVGPDGSMPAAECTTSDWNIGATSGSGKFDCTAAFTIMPSGASVAGGRIVGEFTANA
jgi:hypothetical protein